MTQQYFKRRDALKAIAALCAAPALSDAADNVAKGQAFKLFDSHAHLISPDRIKYPAKSLVNEPVRESAFINPITVERLIEAMDANGVAQACAVQRARIYGYDNRYITDSVRRYPKRLRAIVVVDATSDATPKRMREYVSREGVFGIRLMSNREDGALDWLDSAQSLEVWRAAKELRIPVVIEFYQANVIDGFTRLLKLLERIPDVPVVLDHLGFPPPEGAPNYGLSDAWQPLREHPSIYFKYSTINAEGVPAAGTKGLVDRGIDPAAFVRHAVDLYGADRVMWGSDIGQSNGTYAELVQLGKAMAARLSIGEQRKVLHDTAARVFKA
ncbi:MAG: amidohydrolase family protein [Steroidobacteraceae bacterium]